ncbi:hypothetical protein [Azospirillum brasilense]|uniref:hypothetical protein n=1 Tax=Azospirillum brasilense TaxID=192 RepID=UPI001585EDFC|nr:hypothetical protein [Azospirillum brasilense]
MHPGAALFRPSSPAYPHSSRPSKPSPLERGEPWLGSAFVVNDTHVSGYQPRRV